MHRMTCLVDVPAGSLLGLVGYLATLVAFAFAVFLFRTNPGAAANRRLAIVLVFEGIFAAFLGTYVLFYPPGPLRETAPGGVTAYGFAMTAAIIPWFYLLFLGTLRTPWVAPWAGRQATRITLVGAATVVLVVALARPLGLVVVEGIVVGIGPGAYAVVSFYALGVAISALR